MTITTKYYSVSGYTLDDCCYLGQRYDDKRGYQADEDECWVIVHSLDEDGDFATQVTLGTTALLSQLWRSPSGAVYVCDVSEGEINVNPDLNADDSSKRWKEYDLGVTLAGVWGLDDKFVLTWGSTFEGQHHLFCFDGKKWKGLPAPEFAIRAIHGPERNFLYAVGREGGVARWDGKTWKTFPTPTDEVLTSVFVAGADEYYATGAKGILLEGSAHGWGKLASCPLPKMPLIGVAKWKGELWVGGGSLGLYQRDGSKNKLKLIKPALKANSFDTRKNLLIGCEEFIAQTVDGKKFTSGGEEVLLEERDGMELGDI